MEKLKEQEVIKNDNKPNHKITNLIRGSIAALVISGCTIVLNGIPMNRGEPQKVEKGQEINKQELKDFFLSKVVPMALNAGVPFDTRIPFEFDLKGKRFTGEFLIHIDKDKVQIPCVIKCGEEVVIDEIFEFDISENPMLQHGLSQVMENFEDYIKPDSNSDK